MTFDHTIWEDIAESLQVTYGDKVYFTPETINNDNVLDPLTVTAGIMNFFGTKPLNLVIIGRPLGWQKLSGIWAPTNWFPPFLVEAQNKHKATYDQYGVYQTHIWTDFIFVNRIMAENPDSMIEEMMNFVDENLEGLCNGLSDFGFTYHGRINDAVEANFFYSIIDDFLALRSTP